MSQVGLIFLIVLKEVHKEFNDQLEHIEATNKFVSNKLADQRLTIFGKFTERNTVGV